MRVGDIIVNPWVSRYYNGFLNPNYATIYLGDNKSLDYKGRVCSWAEKVYREDLERPWRVIGYIDLKDEICDAVADEIAREAKEATE